MTIDVRAILGIIDKGQHAVHRLPSRCISGRSPTRGFHYNGNDRGCGLCTRMGMGHGEIGSICSTSAIEVCMPARNEACLMENEIICIPEMCYFDRSEVSPVSLA